VLVVDDHAVVRAGIASMLDAEDGLRVVAEAADGQRLAERCAEVAPTVVVLDLLLPGLGGLDALRSLLRERPETWVVVFSMHADEPTVRDALRVGARGYVTKADDPRELAAAVRAVAAGGTYLAPKAQSATRARADRAPLDPYDTLTAREREVTRLVASGLTSARIAALLGISVRTVDVHRANILRKLRIETVAELVRIAIRRGLVPLT
jgi:DNA-binding NarL/FixJ family response regulator